MTQSDAPDPDPPVLKVRIEFGPDFMLGPGKVDLLEHIRETGSISAAGRKMGMSYKRAWMLVETMNAAFRAPVVESARGGAKGGGAHLTAMGEAVLTRYRALQRELDKAGAKQITALHSLLADMSGGK